MTRLNGACLFFGAMFGFLFCAAGFNQYNVIHGMLLLQNIAPYLTMASAVAVAMPALWLLERRGWHTPLGGALVLRRWSVQRKHVYGGAVFGTGWAITGACPGTVFGTLGSGCLLGFVLVAGIFAGIALRDSIAERAIAPHTEQAAERVPVQA